MNSGQLSESTSDELNGHGLYSVWMAENNLFFARMDLADLQRRLPPPTPTEIEAATKRVEAAREEVIRAQLAKQSALLTNYFPTDRAPRDESLAHFDILHRQQMLGPWPDHINNEAIQTRIDAPAKAVEQHRNSLLGKWITSCRGPPRKPVGGKLSKRRFRKNKTKTKIRRHKNTKRGRL